MTTKKEVEVYTMPAIFWLLLLPKDQMERALRAIEEQQIDREYLGYNHHTIECHSVKDALWMGFTWNLSQEGYEYWEKIYEKCEQ
jgi:hypothetical protein